MKKIVFILLLLMFIGCEKDVQYDAPLGKYKRSYDVNSSDPVLRKISEYNAKYDKHIIVDPDSSDYMYNFMVKNKLRIVMPEQTQEHLLYGINMLEELFLNGYGDETRKKFFPYSLIIGDSIISSAGWSPADVESFTSRNFFALNVGGKTKGLTEQKKKELSIRLHLLFFNNYLIVYRPEFDLTNFYKICSNYGETVNNGKNDPDDPKITQEQIYARGFIKGTEFGQYRPTMLPDKTVHAQQWLEFLLSRDPAEIQKIISEYDLMKRNHDELVRVLNKDLGIDYTKLSYKPKV